MKKILSFILVLILIVSFPVSVFAYGTTVVGRAAFVSVIVHAKGVSPSRDSYEYCYSDVKKQSFSDEVCYAKSQGWLPDFGSKFKPYKGISSSEILYIISRAFSGYVVYSSSQTQTQNQTVVPNPPSGYPDPWMPSGTTNQQSQTTPSNYPTSFSSTCQSLGISSALWRGSTMYSINYCALDNTGSPSSQFLIGQGQLSVVWGAPFNFTITDKMRAMSVGYASEMFNINPNYLMGLMIKESKGDCSYYGGCFQITGGFPEVRNRYSLYFDSNDSEQELVSSFGTAAVIASLYIRFAEVLWDSLYQWKTFYQSASDSAVRAKMVSRGYNRGLWETEIRNMLQTNRTTCQAATDIFSQFPSGDLTTANGIAKDHARAVVDYCTTLMKSSNFYDADLTWQNITDFIDQVLKPTFSSSANVNWSNVQQRANDLFNCLRNSNNTISFRYDFKTFLQKLEGTLPSVPNPVL